MKLFSEKFRPIFAPEGGEGAAASDSGVAGSPSTTPSGAADAAPATPEPSTPSPPAEGRAREARPDFSALGMPMDDDDDVLIIPDTPVSPPAPATPEPPPATAQPAAQPPTAKPQEAPKAPAAPPPPTAAAPAAQQAAGKDDPEGLVGRLSEHREAIIDGLASQRFQLSSQEIDAVTADPAAAVPRLLARAFFESTQASLLHMQNFVPKLVVQLMRDMKEHDEVENRFYGNHKPLEKLKHDQDVKQFARAFRAANPKITEAELFPMVAYAVMAKHGLAAGAAQAAQPPVTNGRAPATPAFVPARPGVGGARVTVSAEEDPWAGLGRNYDD